jgi:nucleoid-associated protein YgaU
MCSIALLDFEQMFDILEGMSRTRVRHRRLTVAVVVSLVAVAGLQGQAGEAGAGPGSPSRRPGSRSVAAPTYVVRPGDTVWRIAERLAGPGADPRPLVDGIVESNGVDPGALMAGQTLVIPTG